MYACEPEQSSSQCWASEEHLRRQYFTHVTDGMNMYLEEGAGYISL